MSATRSSERFPSTATTLIEALMRGSTRDVQQASELLARAYYQPIHTYIRLRWRADDELANDLTQSFFEQVIAQERLAGFTPDRGKLRTYIRRNLDSFVIDRARRRRAKKRGGDARHVPLDEHHLGADFDAERAFHRAWVRHVLELAQTELAAELTEKNKHVHLKVFEALHDEDPPSHHDLATTLDISKVDVNNRLSYARRTFRRIVVRLITQLTASPEECEQELAALSLD